MQGVFKCVACGGSISFSVSSNVCVSMLCARTCVFLCCVRVHVSFYVVRVQKCCVYTISDIVWTIFSMPAWLPS